MPIVGLDITATQDFQSSFDGARGTKEATTFTLGTLDSRVHGHIKDMATKFTVDTRAASNDEAEASVERSAVDFAACQFGIRGWTNFKDRSGNDIPYATRSKSLAGKTYQVVDEAVLRLLPGIVISEISAKILAANDLSVLEKNG